MRRRLPVARLGELLASEHGLTTAEAEERRRLYGRNDIAETSSAGWRGVLRETATDPMLWFLVGTGALYSFLEEYAEALVLLAAIVPLIGMDAFLHRCSAACLPLHYLFSPGIDHHASGRLVVRIRLERCRGSAVGLLTGALALLFARLPLAS